MDAGTGHYRKVREWTKSIADEFDRTIGSMAHFDASRRATDDLSTSLQTAIRALALDL